MAVYQSLFAHHFKFSFPFYAEVQLVTQAFYLLVILIIHMDRDGHRIFYNCLCFVLKMLHAKLDAKGQLI